MAVDGSSSGPSAAGIGLPFFAFAQATIAPPDPDRIYMGFL